MSYFKKKPAEDSYVQYFPLAESAEDSKNFTESKTIGQSPDLSKIDTLYTCSIDPGIVNLEIRLESRSHGIVKKLHSWKIVAGNKKTYFPLVLQRISEGLSKIIPHLKECHVFVIEQQLHENYRALRIAQHIITWLTIQVGLPALHSTIIPQIYEISNRAKYRVLNAPKNLNTKALKKWGTLKALEILQRRGDSNSLTELQNLRKKDDYADTIIQMEAFAILQGWGPSRGQPKILILGANNSKEEIIKPKVRIVSNNIIVEEITPHIENKPKIVIR